MKKITRKRKLVFHERPAPVSPRSGQVVKASSVCSIKEEHLTVPQCDTKVSAARPRASPQHSRSGDEGNVGVVEVVDRVDFSTVRDPMSHHE